MKYTQIGEFEELVLLMVGMLGENAYGVSIKEGMKEQTGRNPSIGALHSALNRLENKGFILSREGGATNERGGRRKRFFELTAAGKGVLQRTYMLRHSLIHKIDGLQLGSSGYE